MADEKIGTWPVSIRCLGLSPGALEVRVFVSWDAAQPLMHADWFSIGDWSLGELLVLCEAMKCALPMLSATLKAQALLISAEELPGELSVWKKVLENKRSAPGQCRCQSCLVIAAKAPQMSSAQAADRKSLRA